MPFTPFHMGPGLAVKSVAGRQFSVLAFGLAQVAMDIEPLMGILLDWDVLHGPSHTYAGALAIGLAVTLIARPIAEWILVRWNRFLRDLRLERLTTPDTIPRSAIVCGTFVGTLSHVALDSMMHADMQPLAPFSQANRLLLWISIDTLHVVCAVAGVAGVTVWLLTRLARNRSR